MKLLRYGNPGQEKPGMLDQNGTIRDLSNIVEDIAGDLLLPVGLEKLKNLDPGSLPTIEGSPRIGACVSGIGKPDEIAALAVYLASDESAYTTGVAWNICGGMTI